MIRELRAPVWHVVLVRIVDPRGRPYIWLKGGAIQVLYVAVPELWGVWFRAPRPEVPGEQPKAERKQCELNREDAGASLVPLPDLLHGFRSSHFWSSFLSSRMPLSQLAGCCHPLIWLHVSRVDQVMLTEQLLNKNEELQH